MTLDGSTVQRVGAVAPSSSGDKSSPVQAVVVATRGQPVGPEGTPASTLRATVTAVSGSGVITVSGESFDLDLKLLGGTEPPLGRSLLIRLTSSGMVSILGQAAGESSAAPAPNGTPTLFTQTGMTFSKLATLGDTSRLGSTEFKAASLESVAKDIMAVNGALPPGAAQRAILLQAIASFAQTCVDRSGLFYESHLKQWVDGKRTKEQLLLEPQNLSNGMDPGFAEDASAASQNQDLSKNAQVLARQFRAMADGTIAFDIEGMLENRVSISISPDQNHGKDKSGKRQFNVTLNTIDAGGETVAIDLNLNKNLVASRVRAVGDSAELLKRSEGQFKSDLQAAGLSSIKVAYEKG